MFAVACASMLVCACVLLKRKRCKAPAHCARVMCLGFEKVFKGGLDWVERRWRIAVRCCMRSRDSRDSVSIGVVCISR